jgi:hypothetical protein
MKKGIICIQTGFTRKVCLTGCILQNIKAMPKVPLKLGKQKTKKKKNIETLKTFACGKQDKCLALAWKDRRVVTVPNIWYDQDTKAVCRKTAKEVEV